MRMTAVRTILLDTTQHIGCQALAMQKAIADKSSKRGMLIAVRCRVVSVSTLGERWLCKSGFFSLAIRVTAYEIEGA
jgi:hypothetical protein